MRNLGLTQIGLYFSFIGLCLPLSVATYARYKKNPAKYGLHLRAILALSTAQIPLIGYSMQEEQLLYSRLKAKYLDHLTDQ